jgi:dTMP kinase
VQNDEKPRGKYICFEGGDGCGKSTLAKAVRDALIEMSIGVVPARFPSDGIIGTMIRNGLRGANNLETKPFLYLFAADGLQQEMWIEDQLYKGHHIICDRHPTLSGRAYQPKHHEPAQIEAVYNAAAFDGISMPTHLFVVEVSAEEAIRRMKGRDKYVDVVFESNLVEDLEEIRNRYRSICYRYGGIFLDGHKPIRELVDEVLEKTGLA